MRKNSINWWTVFEVEEKKKELRDLESEAAGPDFWKNQEKAPKINQKIAALKEEVENIENLKQELAGLKELSLSVKTSEDQGELESEISAFEDKIKKEEFRTFLSGKYDRNDAILQILSGAGGVDAQDWATMLLRMYDRYCQRKGFKVKLLHQSFGEGVGPEGRIGTKSATMEVRGNFAYGFLKKENGVHRLVRISPFSAQKLRHTSFVLVEIMPEIGSEDEKEIEIRPQDLKIDFYRASGPGGQYVNKRETSVRITHLPTSIVVACQSERTQGDNRKQAMKMLLSKLRQLLEETKQKKISQIKGKKISASWGNQIRSYVLHPYKLVKDLRTDLETSDTEGVLNGDLDKFIEAELRL